MFNFRFKLTFVGPSFNVDTACSSGMTALCNAVAAIRGGRCQSAIVGTTNIILRPESSCFLHRINLLSEEGACKSFDESGKLGVWTLYS